MQLRPLNVNRFPCPIGNTLRKEILASFILFVCVLWKLTILIWRQEFNYQIPYHPKVMDIRKTLVVSFLRSKINSIFTRNLINVCGRIMSWLNQHNFPYCSSEFTTLWSDSNCTSLYMNTYSHMLNTIVVERYNFKNRPWKNLWNSEFTKWILLLIFYFLSF